MKVLCVLAVFCFSLALAADPIAQFPVAFSSTLDLFRRAERRSVVARWFRDEKAQMERFDTSGEHGYDIDIKRYDEGKRYTIYHERDVIKCTVTTISEEMPPINLSGFTYDGQVVINSIPAYEFISVNGSDVAKYFQGVGTKDPIRLETSGPNEEILDFFEFDSGSQDETLFNVSAVAPGVICNNQLSNHIGSVRMAWLDARDERRVDYFAPPLMTPPSNITLPTSCESGQASWYSCSGSGACAACSPSEYMAAHKTLPCGTAVTVTDIANGRSVNVKIEDRGPYVAGRIIDMNQAPAQALDMISAGVVNARVCS